MQPPKTQLSKFIEARKAAGNLLARPGTPELAFICKTLWNINDYLDACGIDLDMFEAAKTTIRNLTLLYLRENVPVDKQNKADVDLLIQNTVETHGWLSAYEDCWPARVYLNRYWRTRTTNRRQYYRRIEVASPRRRGRPPKRQREEAASDVQTTPEQVYSLQPSKQKQFVLSDDVRLDSSISSSDTEGSSSEFRDENESTMSLFDRVQLDVRQRGQCMLPDGQAGPQLRRSPPPSFPGIRRNPCRKTTSSTSKQSALSHDSDTGFSPRRVFVAPRMEEGHDSGSKPSGADSKPVKQFLSSLRPSLELHLGAFLELGVRDHATLMAFLSWPQAIQEQWIDKENETLQLTRLERGSLLVGCSMFTLGVWQRSLE